MSGSDEYEVGFIVYPEEKSIEVVEFKYNIDEERGQILKENGINVY